MEITFHGANCFKVSTKSANVIIDDNLKKLGGKSVAKPGDIFIKTHQGIEDYPEAKIVIDGPGEYEVSNISIIGVGARAHMDDESGKTATMYKIMINDVHIAFTGHIFSEVTGDEIEELGHVDILVVPVGNKGYTLDGTGALKVIKEIDPKIVIPSHFADKGLKYEVEQDSLEEALKSFSMEVSERTPKLKIKQSDLPENLQLIVLEK